MTTYKISPQDYSRLNIGILVKRYRNRHLRSLFVYIVICIIFCIAIRPRYAQELIRFIIALAIVSFGYRLKNISAYHQDAFQASLFACYL